MRLLSAAAVLLLTGTTGLPAMADTLSMPREEAPSRQQAPATGMPVKGLTMRQVEARFGQPTRKLPPVGDPPITRWVYAGYTVYFEHQYVIHSVVNR